MHSLFPCAILLLDRCHLPVQAFALRAFVRKHQMGFRSLNKKMEVAWAFPACFAFLRQGPPLCQKEVFFHVKSPFYNPTAGSCRHHCRYLCRSHTGAAHPPVPRCATSRGRSHDLAAVPVSGGGSGADRRLFSLQPVRLSLHAGLDLRYPCHISGCPVDSKNAQQMAGRAASHALQRRHRGCGDRLFRRVGRQRLLERIRFECADRRSG